MLNFTGKRYMMADAKRRFTLYLAIMTFLLSACSNYQWGKINLVDAKIVTAVDEKLMPVQITNSFPKGTSRVSCWLEWRSAKINTQLVAKWHYLTDDIHILDYNFSVPKREGTGSVSLSMPNDKALPSGRYRLDLVLGRRILKSLSFTVE